MSAKCLGLSKTTWFQITAGAALR